jgi:galactose mutarotase-like enzyme
MYPMAPFAGRIRDGRFSFDTVEHQLRVNLAPHAIHGTVFDRSWQVDHADQHGVQISTELGPNWPMAGRCRQRFTLDPAAPGLLTTEISVHAVDESFPVSLGWHPWFRTRLHDTAALVPFRPSLAQRLGRQVQRGDDAMPSGQWCTVSDAPWDDCFDGVQWPLSLRWVGPDGSGIGLEITSDARYVVIYDERAEAWCVEPQSAPPAVIDGAIGRSLGIDVPVVTPERPVTLTAYWRAVRH